MNHINKYLSLSLLFSLLALSGHAQEGTVIDKVVAVVGQNIIKMSDVEQNYNQVRVKQGYNNAFENRCNILEGMLVSKLLIHKGTIDSTEVDDAEVEARVQQRIKEIDKINNGIYNSRNCQRPRCIRIETVCEVLS